MEFSRLERFYTRRTSFLFDGPSIDTVGTKAFITFITFDRFDNNAHADLTNKIRACFF